MLAHPPENFTLHHVMLHSKLLGHVIGFVKYAIDTSVYPKISTEPLTITTNSYCWLQNQKNIINQLWSLVKSCDTFEILSMAEYRTLAGVFVDLYASLQKDISSIVIIITVNVFSSAKSCDSVGKGGGLKQV